MYLLFVSRRLWRILKRSGRYVSSGSDSDRAIRCWKLSDVIKAVQDVQDEIEAELNSFTTVVDVTKCRLYKKNFGEFFSNHIEYAGAIILSRTDKAKPEKVEESVELLRELNERLRSSQLQSSSCQERSFWRQWSTANLWKKSCSWKRKSAGMRTCA